MSKWRLQFFVTYIFDQFVRYQRFVTKVLISYKKTKTSRSIINIITKYQYYLKLLGTRIKFSFFIEEISLWLTCLIFCLHIFLFFYSMSYLENKSFIFMLVIMVQIHCCWLLIAASVTQRKHDFLLFIIYNLYKKL